MIQPNLDSTAFKELLKEALAETLDEKRELLHEIFAEVLEDLAMAEAIREGQQTERVTRDEIFDVLEDRA